MSAEINPYLPLPFRFERFKSKIFVVNEAGEFSFFNPDTFDKFISYQLDTKSEDFLNIKAKHFATNTAITPVIDLLSTKYRTKRGFLSAFTALHMVVITLRCNHHCRYCHASSQNPDDHQWDMDEETALRVVYTIMQTPSPAVKIEFQGGEPTLNFKIVKIIVKEAKRINKKRKKDLSFVICTNLTTIDDSILNFLKKEHILVSTSLDGPKEIHDRHRILRDGRSSYELFTKNLEHCREILGRENVSALMTSTKDSLSNLEAIIDEYISHSFGNIFIRNLNPYGYARSPANQDRLSYSIETFIAAYKKALLYIFELNRKGIRFAEDFASILLSRILTPFSTGFVDLQSPTGAGISGVIYHYNGDVYPSDESRMLAQMGDNRFYMGNVKRNSYFEIFKSKILMDIINSSCVETLPGCNSCSLQVFCGSDPIRNYATQGNLIGHRPSSEFCSKHKTLIKFFLEIIEDNDPEIMDIIWSWITRRSLDEVKGINR